MAFFNKSLPLFLFQLLTIASAGTFWIFCKRCCIPTNYYIYLPYYVIFPFLFLVITAIVIWVCWLGPLVAQRQAEDFEEKMSYHGNIPFAGEFTYRFFERVSNGFWKKNPECNVKFIDSTKLEFQNVQHSLLASNFETRLEEHSKFDVDDRTFYLTALPDNEKPGLVCSSPILIMLPEDSNIKPETLFPKERFPLLVCFSLIVGLVCLSILLFFETNEGYFYSSHYREYVLGYPWGTFMSIFGILLFIVYINPFEEKLRWLNDNRERLLFVLLAMIALLCFAFSFFDFVAVGFISNREVINTRKDYYLAHQQSFVEYCRFDQYNCSVVYEANLTDVDESCENGFVMQCFSYNMKSHEYCVDERNVFVNMFVFQGIIELFLFVLWLLLVGLWMNLDWIYWESIQQRLLRINCHKNREEVIK